MPGPTNEDINGFARVRPLENFSFTLCVFTLEVMLFGVFSLIVRSQGTEKVPKE
jgi:hypothetical protein